MTEKILFISWSKPASGEIALKLCEIIESLPLGVKCWISKRVEDLPQGPYDHKRIVEAAQSAFACVSILTPGNVVSPWIFFESGVFYGLNKKNFALLACGLTHSDMKKVNNPIEGYHAYIDKKDSFVGLIKSINIAANNIEERRFKSLTEKSFTRLKAAETAACNIFSDKKMIDELDFIKKIT